MRDWRKKNPNYSKRYRKTIQRWTEENREKVRDMMRKYRNKNREKLRAKQLVFAHDNPEKIKAHNLSRNLPLASKCELCPDDNKRIENLQRHHPDYNYPKLFITVCPSCHYSADRTTEEIL